MRPLHYRRDGTPYPDGAAGMMEWAVDFEKGDRHVGHDKLTNGVEVSTVWLGLDHNYSDTGRPLIFETMLFVSQKKTIDIFGHKIQFNNEEIGECWRYSTEEEARLGHKMQVKKWSKFKSIDQLIEKG